MRRAPAPPKKKAIPWTISVSIEPPEWIPPGGVYSFSFCKLPQYLSACRGTGSIRVKGDLHEKDPVFPPRNRPDRNSPRRRLCAAAGRTAAADACTDHGAPYNRPDDHPDPGSSCRVYRQARGYLPREGPHRGRRDDPVLLHHRPRGRRGEHLLRELCLVLAGLLRKHHLGRASPPGI